MAHLHINPSSFARAPHAGRRSMPTAIWLDADAIAQCTKPVFHGNAVGQRTTPGSLGDAT